MNISCNPDMLILARESAGITQRAFAEQIGIAQGRLSRYESGLARIPDDHLRLVAEELGLPLEFFEMNEKVYSASCMYHRKKKSLSVADEKRIHAQVNLLRIRAIRLLRETEIESEHRFHRLDVAKLGSPEAVAQSLRRLWQLPTGPIRSVVGAIEAAGGVVFRCPFGSTKVDGISQWTLDSPETPPVFFARADTPGDRLRFTLCHEIGHVTMHHLPTADPEREADRFAGEFLMPAREIAGDLNNMTLQKAASLKTCWRVSMAAIIRRAKDLGKLSERQYKYLNMQMAKRGYKSCEPIPIPAEEPEMLKEIISVHRRSHGRSIADLSRLLGMFERDFVATYWDDLASGIRLVS